jgi:amino acid transporter
MVEFSVSNARYTYVHDQENPSQNADMHHIVLRRNCSKYFFVYASALLVLACAIYLCYLEVCLPTNFLCLWLEDVEFENSLTFSLFLSFLLGYIPSINRKNRSVLCITACFLTYFLSSCYFGSLLIKVSTWLTGHVMLWKIIVIIIVEQRK